MHSFSILKAAFKEASPALIHAHYSRLSIAMLGVTMLRDMPGQFSMWDMLKNFGQHLANSVRKVREAL